MRKMMCAWVCAKSRKVRRTQTLQPDCGPASILSIYDFILQLIPFSTEEAAFPGLIPHSATEKAAGSLTGLINGFPSSQYCCVDFASHGTLPVPPDQAFHCRKYIHRCVSSKASDAGLQACRPLMHISISSTSPLALFLVSLHLCWQVDANNSSPFTAHAFAALKKNKKARDM